MGALEDATSNLSEVPTEAAQETGPRVDATPYLPDVPTKSPTEPGQPDVKKRKITNGQEEEN
jgi:hypothetical protein